MKAPDVQTRGPTPILFLHTSLHRNTEAIHQKTRAISDYRRAIHYSRLRAKYLGVAFIQEIPPATFLA